MKKSLRNRLIILSFILVAVAASSYLVFIENNSYTVRFYSDSNVLLKTDHVKRNSSAVPPIKPEVSLGSVFSRWDVSFASVKKDLAVHAVSIPVPKSNNVFALSGNTGKSGDGVYVPLLLSGKVCLSSFNIEISYNPEELKFDDIIDADSMLVYGNDNKKGIIHINYMSTENTVGSVDLGLLKFTALAKKDVNSTVAVKVMETNAYDCNHNFYSPDSSTINATISIFS